ncbi:hypothetical protein D0863_05490 [Hortaea werneckii]|uniref:Association with the SNF1 complex (ASC) domain-containing protein n=1 Tax=Hortaea werneckii TaxID=91943 RepID=A0A3M7E2W8_HORWE|nr:hypothetical protein D0863_05490 [Hortaea werneckii]
MGNSESHESRSPSGSKPATPQSLRHKHSIRNVSRKPSHAPPAAPAPPTTTLVPSASSASTSTSTTHAHAHTHTSATVAHSPASGHSRARSITSYTPGLHKQESEASQKSASNSPMGNSESRHRPPSRAQTLPPHESDYSKAAASPSARPVDVPHQSDGLNEKDAFEPSNLPNSDLHETMLSQRWDRPPRLPLPIEHHKHSPGSPILSPQDHPRHHAATAAPAPPSESGDGDGNIPRRTSVVSSNMDDDEEGDHDGLTNEAQTLQPTVPTPITWRGSGERVYVTGTFVNWERKFKLHRDRETGVFSAVLQLKPGTHHLKFLVGGDMVTSDDLPTTVDYTNILVNYIEVVAPLPQTQQQPPAPAEPMPIPGAAVTAGQATATGEPAARPLDIRTEARAPETAADIPSAVPSGAAPEFNSSAGPPAEQDDSNQVPQPSQPEPKSTGPPKQRGPRPKYTNQIPAYLLHLDVNNPEDERFQRAKAVEGHLPQPPSLPMFLGKSILNATTPHKDDASVLTMPNHTVLNHLATSSIKNGVLATSGTTRYKRKFLTTIMHKPTSEKG